MNPLPLNASDADLIAFADRWAQLMDVEEYEAAFLHTEHLPEMHWTPSLISEVVKAYGDADANQKVTFAGEPTDITQRKRVRRHAPNAHGFIGGIYYDLNINGYPLFSDADPLAELTKQGWELWHRGNYFDEETLTWHYHLYRDPAKAEQKDESSHYYVRVRHKFRDGKLHPEKPEDDENGG